MRKSADVAILMNINAESYKLLYPATIDWDAFCAQKPDVPFSEEIIDYLETEEQEYFAPQGHGTGLARAHFCQGLL